MNDNDTLDLSNVFAAWKSTLDVGGHAKGRAVSFNAEMGKWVALIGNNGIGKSTLLHAIAGTANYVYGRIRVAGKALHPCDPAERFRIGVQHVPQIASLPRALSVDELVEITFNRRPGLRMDKPIDDLIRQLREWQIIGPEGQNVPPRIGDFLCAVLSQPRVLLLDEILEQWPANASTEDAYDQIQRILPYTTVVFTDHNRQRAIEAADNVLLLRESSNGQFDDESGPLYLDSNSDELASMLTNIPEESIPLELERHSVWNIVRFDQAPRSQLALAIRCRFPTLEDQRSKMREICSDFRFLSKPVDPAEWLSGGQQVILLWFLVTLTRREQIPGELMGHIDGVNLRKLNDKWKQRLQ